MTNSSGNKNTLLFRILACMFTGAAIFHLVNIFYRTDNSPTWRHLLFFVIGIACAYFFLVRPKYFLFLFIILFIQQYYSHGSSLIHQWTETHTVNWISIAVLLAFPCALILLLQDYKTKFRKSL